MYESSLFFSVMLTLLNLTLTAEATQRMNTLTPQQESIVAISALAASGEIEKLKTSLHEGLESGLTVNEIKELLVQLYAYAGFPRSLNALGTFMNVLDARKEKGITDTMGKEASPLPTNRSSLEFGTENQTKLTGRPVKGALFDFAPAIDQFLKAHLFGDIFQRDNLDWLNRELATIAILASIKGLNPQLQAHIQIGMHNGITVEQLKKVVLLLTKVMGSSVGENMQKVLDEVLSKS